MNLSHDCATRLARSPLGSFPNSNATRLRLEIPHNNSQCAYAIGASPIRKFIISFGRTQCVNILQEDAGMLRPARHENGVGIAESFE
jgi:hypothetical protein